MVTPICIATDRLLSFLLSFTENRENSSVALLTHTIANIHNLLHAGKTGSDSIPFRYATQMHVRSPNAYRSKSHIPSVRGK